jgi:PAS domain S-box-containing protein
MNQIVLNVVDYLPALHARSAQLRRAGFDVLEADSGQKAVELSARGTAHLVLIDTGLSDIDGFELCRRIRSNPAAAAPLVVLVSADGDSASRERGLEAGADGYLSGSADPADMLATITALLRARQAEEALRDSETRFLALYAQTAVGIAFANREGRLVLVNDALCDLLQRSRAELVTLPIRDLVHPDDREAEDRCLRLLLRGESDTCRLERRLLRQDGIPVWVRTTSSIARDEAGRLLHRVLVVEDQTERRRAEEEREHLLTALEGERRRLETVLDQMPAGVLIASAPSGKLLMANRRNEAIWRRSFQALSDIQQYVQWEGYRPDGSPYLPAEWPIARSILTGEVVVNEEIEIVRGDGTRGTILMSSAPVRDRNGHVRAGVATDVDITERRRAEAHQQFLADASKALASLDHSLALDRVANVAVPAFADVCLIHLLEEGGARNTVAHVNGEKEKWLCELEEETPVISSWLEPVLRTLEPILFPDFSETDLSSFVHHPAYKRIIEPLRLRSAMILPLLSGARTLGLIAFACGADESGRRYGRGELAVARDLTGRIASAIDNARLYASAREASRLKDEFLATLSHELRTPLNAILGWIQMLSSGALDSSVSRRAIEAIDRNARTQTRLISEILDVSRIITGKLKLKLQEVNLAAVAEEVCESERPAADARRISLERRVDHSLTMLGDPERLQQVLWNLLSNAIKFTPEGGSVEVSGGWEGEAIRLSVKDTGIGIRPEFLPHVFERFRQGDASSTRVHGGLGLGLAIARHVVELHGGTITAESEGPGHGATFTLHLPATVPWAGADRQMMPAAPGAAPEEPHTEGASSGILTGIVALVVDDEPETCEVLRVMLEEAGVTPTTASSAELAMLELRRGTFDVVITDIAMPFEDGYSLLHRIRSLPGEKGRVATIALTAYASAGDRAKALDAGFRVYLTKPVSRTALLSAIAAVTGREAGSAEA